MADRLEIPSKEHWPVGFTTDYVTMFPDKPLLFTPRKGWKVWTWWRQVDLRAVAWWHDVRYYTGRMSRFHELKHAVPWSNGRRTEVDRFRIDEEFRRGCVRVGVHPATAEAMYWFVRNLGSQHYYWRRT